MPRYVDGFARMGPETMPFDTKRMIYGGFKVMVAERPR
jgi:uncharacterized protein YbaA (DUF1428 family)